MKNFDEFYEENKSLIGSCLVKYKNLVPDEDELESIINLCFFKAYQKYESKEAKFSTFLHRCVRNKCLDYRKQLLKRKMLSTIVEEPHYTQSYEHIDINNLKTENDIQRGIIDGIVGNNKIADIKRTLNISRHVFVAELSRIKKLNEEYFSNH